MTEKGVSIIYEDIKKISKNKTVIIDGTKVDYAIIKNIPKTVTRTVALGPCSVEQKKHFTAVLRGHLNLVAAKFLHSVREIHHILMMKRKNGLRQPLGIYRLVIQ